MVSLSPSVLPVMFFKILLFTNFGSKLAPRFHRAKHMLILPAQSQHTTNWSGGTTTQLFIYPEGSCYANRNFLFRISTATVETETSTFTSLPGFARILMILKGSLLITHNDHHTKTLHPFATDTFDGGWETSAIGKVTDFNLMMAAGVKGECKHESLQPKQSVTVTVKADFYGIYWLQGNAKVRCKEEEYMLGTKDFISFNKGESFTIVCEDTCDWVSVVIQYPQT